MSPMLKPVPVPGLLVTGTDTGVGKTLIAGAIAQWFARQGSRVAVCKPCATGCIRRREGLVSADAELLAHCSDAPHPLDLICPQRFAEPLAPAIAAEHAGESIDWPSIDRAIAIMAKDSDIMVVEGVGGVMVPMDPKHTFLDAAQWLRLPAIIVARAGLGTINHTLLTLAALRARKIRIAGVIINRYPAETAGLAEEANPRAIEKWGRVPILCIVPEAAMPREPAKNPVPGGVAAAIKTVDWTGLV